MSLTQAEILTALGLAGKSGVRAVVNFAEMDLDEAKCETIFRQFAGDDAVMPDNRIQAVVSYLIYDAAMGKPLDVADCIARANRLDCYNFTDGAKAERVALKAQKAAKAAEKAAAKAEKASVPREVVNADGTVSRRRGRAPAGVASAFDRVAELWRTATDRSKDGFIATIQQTLGMGHGSAQTYYYKAKKEIKL